MNQDSRYTDLMQEIKERLHAIEDVFERPDPIPRTAS